MKGRKDFPDYESYGGTIYHAGLSKADREANMKEFVEGRKKLIFCTTSFGIGVDIADVAFSIHAGSPYTLGNYVQESGRIGRNGRKAMSYIIYMADDEYHSGADLMGKDKIYQLLRLQEECTRGFMSAEFDSLATTCFAIKCYACGNCHRKTRGGK